MGYNNYKNLKQTLKKLASEETDIHLFPQVELKQPSSWLIKTLAIAEELPLTNEKSKSERITSNVLDFTQAKNCMLMKNKT